jgi:hypothetical protein
MSKLLLRSSLLGLAILAAATLPAAAEKKVNIGTRTKDYMKDLCTGDGRTYVEGQGQYGCISNCGDPSKTSDACGINCSEKDNQCYGWTPGRVVVRNPRDILGGLKLNGALNGGLLEGGGSGLPTNAPSATGTPLPPRGAPAGRIN